MIERVVLKPDKNRPMLKSELAGKLQDVVMVDSLSKLNYSTWEKGETPRIMLMVPSYTRIKRPMDVICQEIESNVKNSTYLAKDREIISVLKQAGITSLEEMKRAGVPMGFLRIGTAAKKKGYEVKIVDGVFEGWSQESEAFTSEGGNLMIRYGLTNEELESKIREFAPHIVGITCSYTHQWGNARELADLVKTINPSIISVMGGVHINGLPNDALLDSPIDYLTIGQSDDTFPELLDVLTQRPSREIVNIEDVMGIKYRKEGEIKRTKFRSFSEGLKDIAIPDLDLIDLNLYSGPFHSAGKRKKDSGFLTYGFSSIGCNTGCNFCAIPSSQGGFREMDPQTMKEYFDYIQSKGVTEFLVEDDHLFHDPEHARRVFSELKGRDIAWVEEGGISLYNMIALLPNVSEAFIAENTSNKSIFEKAVKAKREGVTTEQLIREMKESGCYGAYLAVESANNDSLFTSHKPRLNTNEQYTSQVVSLFNKYGIDVTCGTMLGFVNYSPKEFVESRDQIENTIRYGRFLREGSGASYVNPFIFTPLPGAPHFPNLQKNLGEHLSRNTDEGYSHEFGTIDAPNGEWTRDEMNLLRAKSIIDSNGLDGYTRILKTGTWPV